MTRSQILISTLAVVLIVGAAASSCNSGKQTPPGPPSTPQAAGTGGGELSLDPSPRSKPAVQDAPPQVTPRFLSAGPDVGIDFTFHNDFVSGRFFLPEVMGGGAAWIDFDLDGWLDLYLQNGCELRGPKDKRKGPVTPHPNRLYRSQGGGRFTEVAAAAHALDPHYGQGCAVGDFNADGFPDLFLANYGRNTLLLNNGDGTFEDVSLAAGVADKQWGTSCIWVDLNNDGLLDLYVANYLNVSFANTRICPYNKKPGYCGPGEYDGIHDLAYINQGDGTFQDQAKALGLTPSDPKNAKGLALVALDFDDDRQFEIYVANDMTPNHLYSRTWDVSSPAQRPLYHERARAGGCAAAMDGELEASMGISCADFDNDGRTDIFLTHFYNSKNTLYRNLGKLTFEDASAETNVLSITYGTLGFGTVPFDYDRDGAIDIFIANGHVLGPLQTPNEMHAQLIRNRGGARFHDISNLAGDYFQKKWLGRGAAGGDYDNDGDLDILVTNIHGPTALLRNETQTQRTFVGLKLIRPNRIPPVGGTVTLTAGNQRYVRNISAGGSYLCSGDDRLLFGLGDHQGPVEVEIAWPGGKVQKQTLSELNKYWLIIEQQEAEPLVPLP